MNKQKLLSEIMKREQKIEQLSKKLMSIHLKRMEYKVNLMN